MAPLNVYNSNSQDGYLNRNVEIVNNNNYDEGIKGQEGIMMTEQMFERIKNALSDIIIQQNLKLTQEIEMVKEQNNLMLKEIKELRNNNVAGGSSRSESTRVSKPKSSFHPFSTQSTKDFADKYFVKPEYLQGEFRTGKNDTIKKPDVERFVKKHILPNMKCCEFKPRRRTRKLKPLCHKVSLGNRTIIRNSDGIRMFYCEEHLKIHKKHHEEYCKKRKEYIEEDLDVSEDEKNRLLEELKEKTEAINVRNDRVHEKYVRMSIESALALDIDEYYYFPPKGESVFDEFPSRSHLSPVPKWQSSIPGAANRPLPMSGNVNNHSSFW